MEVYSPQIEIRLGVKNRLPSSGWRRAIFLHTTCLYTHLPANVIRIHVQIILPENKQHVKKFSDLTLCSEELRFALLAQSCLNRGMTTLVTTLVHTTDGTARWNELELRIQQKQEQSAALVRQIGTMVAPVSDAAIQEKLHLTSKKRQIERDLEALRKYPSGSARL